MSTPDILLTLAKAAKVRVEKRLHEHSLTALRAMATERLAEERARTPECLGAFERALRAPGLSVIAECKRASLSNGLIAPEFPYVEIARDYEAGGAAAISVLTEPTQFLGSDRYLEEISHAVATPLFAKRFHCA